MKLPSIEYLYINAKNSFVRFPFTIISALISVTVGVYLNECHKSIVNYLPYINVMLCSSLGISIYFSVIVFSIKKGFSSPIKWLLTFLTTILLVCIYFTFPNSNVTQNTSVPYIRYSVYVVIAHLLVSFIPFAFNKQLNGFWHYNKIMFIRFWTSILYSGFLYVGLSLALLSLKLLFDIKLHEELFFDFFIVIIGFFNTWFFISGIPENFNTLEEITEYPKGLKVFSQYILLPLLVLYLIILYAYGIQIISLWNWPKGLVSYLITCVAVLGILTFLLIYPYGNLSANSWIKKTAKGYYIVLLPLIAILFIAILMRINEYGITINRYLIAFLGLWLLLVCCYSIIRKTNIKFIPISLAIMLTLISFGPWSMFSISENSQIERLKSILNQAKLLEAGKIKNEAVWVKDSLPVFYSKNEAANEGQISDSLHNEVKSILEYLDNHHGFNQLRGLYSQNIDSIIAVAITKRTLSFPLDESEIYMRTLGLAYKTIYKNQNQYFSYSIMASNVANVSGYGFLINFESYELDENDIICSFSIDSISYSLRSSYNNDGIFFLQSKKDTVVFDIQELIKKLNSEYGNNTISEVPNSKMQVYKTTSAYQFKLELESLNFTDSSMMNRIDGNILIRRLNK